MPSPLSSSCFSRAYSPVPPRCPSPQLDPMPLPTPPIYARRPSITQASQEHLPQRQKAKRSCIDTESDSRVFSLKDALVAGPSSARRLSKPDIREPIGGKRPRIVTTEHSFQQGRTTTSTRPNSSPLPSFPHNHRRSDSISRDQPGLSPLSRSALRTRTRSLNARTTQSEAPPPVPPLPPLKSKYSNAKQVLSKKLPPLRIPELGLGIDESLRSPLSPLQLTPTSRKRRERGSKESEAPSFLHMSKSDTKRGSRASLGSSGCVSIRMSHSLPDLKAAKRRSSPSFAVRFLRIGT